MINISISSEPINISECIDDISVVRSLWTNHNDHGAQLTWHTGRHVREGAHPTIGSWINYGLGTVNGNLPGFVVMLDRSGGPISGAKNWSSGYMPAAYQGTLFRSTGDPIVDLKPPSGVSRSWFMA
jgi:hypothetical protein